MDNNFQTSFIPKKPLADERVAVKRGGTSIMSFVAMLVFFAAAASAAGIYFYKASLVKQGATLSAELTAARNSFEPTAIDRYHRLNQRISDSNTLLASHIAVSPIFAALQADTLKSIQFTKFSYLTPTDLSAPITVKMSGKSRDYTSIALESDQLAKNPSIHNPIFANLTLDQQTGMVTFDLVFTVDASLVRFTNNLDTLIQSDTSASSGAAPAAAGAALMPDTSSSQTTPAVQGAPSTGAQSSNGQTPPPPAKGSTVPTP